METVANASLGGWIDVDPDRIRQELESLFPGVRAWFGEFTGSWWALLGGRLVEAADPLTLADRIRRALAPRPIAPAPPHLARRPSTTGAAAWPVAVSSQHAAPSAAAPVHHARPAVGLLSRARRLLGWNVR